MNKRVIPTEIVSAAIGLIIESEIVNGMNPTLIYLFLPIRGSLILRSFFSPSPKEFMPQNSTQLSIIFQNNTQLFSFFSVALNYHNWYLVILVIFNFFPN